MGAIDNSQGFLQVEADVDVAAVLSDKESNSIELYRARAVGPRDLSSR